MKSKILKAVSFVSVILGFFMALLDSTIVNITLPEMTRFYNSSVQQITWVMNAYNLAFAVFIVTASRLADQFGRKKIFIAGISIFTLASFACGISDSVQLLITFRVIQGLAGAVVVPVTVPLIMDMFNENRRGMIMGVWGAIAGLAAASGPALGGILTDNFKWQYIFYVNIPIGIITVILATILIRESYDPTAGKRIDFGGVVALSTAMFSLTYALIQGNDKGWGSALILGLLGMSLLSFIAFFLIEARVKEPMIPLKLLKIGPFNGASLTLLVMGAGMMGAMFMTSFFLTTVMGLSVLKAGLTVSAMPLASIVGSAIAGPLSNKFGSRYFAAIGMAIIALSLYLLGDLSASSSRIDAVYRLLLTGIGMGLTMAPVMGSGVKHVPAEKSGIASGIMNMTRALGTVLGVAIMVAILNSGMNKEMEMVKTSAINIITSDKVLDNNLKTELSSRIKDIKISRESKAPDPKTIEDMISRQEKAVLSKTPEKAKPLVKAGFEQNKAEAGKIMSGLQVSIKDGMSKAFERTFRYGVLILLPGLIFALFSDKKRLAAGKQIEA